LPADARQRVALVAITVDPARDTPEVLQEYSERHGLAENPNWFALTADAATLEPVWASYYVDPGAMMADDHAETDAHDAHGEHADHEATPAAGGQQLTHTDAIFLIDRDGKWRVLLRSETPPKEIADDLAILAG